MVHLGDVPQNLMKILSTAVSTVLLIALFFILQYLFDLDFFCSCRPGVHLHDVLFLIAPPLILTVIVTLMEPFYQKWMFSRCCNYCCNNFCSFIGMFLMKYLYLSAVWVSTVLFDGDWYICMLTNLNTKHSGMPCKKNLTYEETLIRTDYKNASIDWGFAVISGFFLLWNAFNFFQASFSRRKKRSSVSAQYLICPPYYRWVYEDLLSEEVSCYFKEELRKIAKERAKEICKEHVMTIRNHELPEQRQNPGGSNVTNPNENPDGNPNGNFNDNPIGNANENPNGNGNPNGNPNDNPNGDTNENPNANGNLNDNPNGNGNAYPNGNLNVNLNDNSNGRPNENLNGNGNNEEDNIFETWQNISHSYFYLMDEGLP